MISPRAPVIGLPTFRLSSWASSSVLALMSAANLASVRPRLPAAQVAQPLRSSNARRAASTARSTSAGPPSGAVAMTRPVAGLTTSNVCPSAASTDSPPMTICARIGASSEERSRVACLSVVMSSPRGCSGLVRRGRYAFGVLDAAFGRNDCRPDDPRIVAQFGRDDLAFHRQSRDEPVGALADAAAEDHEVGPHQLLDPVEVLIEVGGPRLP